MRQSYWYRCMHLQRVKSKTCPPLFLERPLIQPPNNNNKSTPSSPGSTPGTPARWSTHRDTGASRSRVPRTRFRPGRPSRRPADPRSRPGRRPCRRRRLPRRSCCRWRSSPGGSCCGRWRGRRSAPRRGGGRAPLWCRLPRVGFSFWSFECNGVKREGWWAWATAQLKFMWWWFHLRASFVFYETMILKQCHATFSSTLSKRQRDNGTVYAKDVASRQTMPELQQVLNPSL